MLLTSPGWEVFLRHCAGEWGSGPYSHKMEQAVSTTVVGPDMEGRIKDRVTQVVAAKREIDKLLHWPASRVNELRAKAARPRQAFRRGGY